MRGIRTAILIAALIVGATPHIGRAYDALLSSSFDVDRPINDSEAARFLQQATFGTTREDIAHLRAAGYEGWLTEQMAATPSLEMPYLEWFSQSGTPYQQERVEAWFFHALGAQSLIDPGTVHRDQLRQRMAFVLSQLFVISDRLALIGREPEATTSYYDLLISHAFGNYRDLLEAVTLHPAMGNYLSMFRNRAPVPELNIRPDENYAREILQLFSIGLTHLHMDGSQVLVGGQTVPTYDQDTVRGFAHAFTGWNWHACANWDWCSPDWIAPMSPMPDYHDADAKQLLVYDGVQLPGGVLPAGGTAQSDLSAAIDSVFYHPNVAPFVARHIIRQLVTSNPTPAYIGRAAAVFANDGTGVRGNLAAVVRSILLDPEARYGQFQNPLTFGKPREPLLKLTHLWRAMHASAASHRLKEWNPELSLYQAPLRAPSVFNFFSPTYSPVGELSGMGLVAPEFQLLTDSGLTAQTNEFGRDIYYAYMGNPSNDDDDIVLDLSEDMPFAAVAEALVLRYDTLLLGGTMSVTLHDVLIERLSAITPATSSDYLRERVQEALYLIFVSPDYAVQQ